MSTTGCCGKGPGYSSPLEAMNNGPQEKLLYVTMLPCDENQPNYMATIDVDPSSNNFQKIIHRLYMPHLQDELHHFGWNACSSCHDEADKKRRFIVMGGFKSSRIYVVDTSDEKNLKLHKTIESEELKKFDLSAPHTVHCLGTGEIMISCLGNGQGQTPGGFILLDQNFQIVGNWNKEKSPANVEFFYDFWYKPRHNIMISSEWAVPTVFEKGFDPNDVALNKYGHSLHFWDWNQRKYMKTIDLGPDGAIPLELRFCHNPETPYGFVGCALGSSVFRFFKDESNEWKTEKVIQVEPLIGADGKPIPAIISDLLISLNDKFSKLIDENEKIQCVKGTIIFQVLQCLSVSIENI